MDAATAERLLLIAEESVKRLRRQVPGAAAPVEGRYPEIREALDWLLDTGSSPDAAFRMSSALVPFWISTTRIDEGDAWFTRALSGSQGSEAARATALHDHGYLVFWSGRYDLAERRFRDALTAAEHLANPSLEALALAGLARVALNSDVEEAVRLLRCAVAVTESLPDDDRGRSGALHVLGVALQMSGDLESARDVMTTRLETGRRNGDEFVVWVESANLSMVERRLGNLKRAEELSRAALAIDAGRGDPMSIAWTLNGLAAVTATRGDLVRAATLHGLAAALLTEAGGEWPPDEREQYDETQATVSAGLSADALEAARRRGAAMSLRDGVAYALGEPDVAP